MVSKYVKRSSVSLVLREMQMKTMRYHLTSIIMSKIEKTDHLSGTESIEKMEPAYIASENAKWYGQFRMQLSVSYKN